MITSNNITGIKIDIDLFHFYHICVCQALRRIFFKCNEPQLLDWANTGIFKPNQKQHKGICVFIRFHSQGLVSQ